jgi:hypothetical protein
MKMVRAQTRASVHLFIQDGNIVSRFSLMQHRIAYTGIAVAGANSEGWRFKLYIES